LVCLFWGSTFRGETEQRESGGGICVNFELEKKRKSFQMNIFAKHFFGGTAILGVCPSVPSASSLFFQYFHIPQEWPF
jgi:hypothetical protein